ncbi:MAG: flagellar protein FlaG [Pseudomonadota bacterium]
MATPINSTPTLPSQTGGATSRTQPQQSAEGGEARQVLSGSGSTAPEVEVQQPNQSPQDLAQATRDISDYIQSVSRSLQISVDDDLGTTVIRVLDAETDELVRQIPAEDALALARFISEQQATSAADPVRGILIDSEG